jgi:hypothetical protein
MGLVVVMVTVSCGGRIIPPLAPMNSPLAVGGQVRGIEMGIDSALPADRRASVQTYDATGRTKRQLRAILGSNYAGQGDLVLKVRIREFRLRSKASTIWWGGLAGVDMLGVAVSVEREGAVVKEFVTGVAATEGGADPGNRLDFMVAKLCPRIVAEL